MLKRPISKHYPNLAPLIREVKIAKKAVQYVGKNYQLQKTTLPFPHTVYKSKSLLHRKLGDTSPVLQDAKVHNLKIAVPLFDNLEIKPGQTLSFWKILGRPSYKRGFVDGMLLADGKVTTGVGGGLCQLANMLNWLFLHSPVLVTEHHHHCYDIFPDSGRTIPFGSGAGTLFNYFDLQFKNTSPYLFKLNVSLDNDYLYGKLSSSTRLPTSYKIVEKDHHFYTKANKNYRHNKLVQQRFDCKTGDLLEEVLVRVNDSEVLYALPLSS
jgi:vancomycin resistance protein VanW